MKPHFLQLNLGWNADPNAPHPNVEVLGSDILLGFYVNPFQFKEFEEDEVALTNKEKLEDKSHFGVS